MNLLEQFFKRYEKKGITRSDLEQIFSYYKVLGEEELNTLIQAIYTLYKSSKRKDYTGEKRFYYNKGIFYAYDLYQKEEREVSKEELFQVAEKNIKQEFKQKGEKDKDLLYGQMILGTREANVYFNVLAKRNQEIKNRK